MVNIGVNSPANMQITQMTKNQLMHSEPGTSRGTCTITHFAVLVIQPYTSSCNVILYSNIFTETLRSPQSFGTYISTVTVQITKSNYLILNGGM